ncbi:MAG: hypothetical protein KGI60_02980 [Patescibacteria group bacterium]|nr:hypothetical protein [Patescibacteria group bacterium]
MKFVEVNLKEIDGNALGTDMRTNFFPDILRVCASLKVSLFEDTNPHYIENMAQFINAIFSVSDFAVAHHRLKTKSDPLKARIEMQVFGNRLIRFRFITMDADGVPQFTEIENPILLLFYVPEDIARLQKEGYKFICFLPFDLGSRGS